MQFATVVAASALLLASASTRGRAVTASSAPTLHPSAASSSNGSFSVADLNGSYAFYLEAEGVSGAVQGPIAAVGVIVADGLGNIPLAKRTLNLAGTVIANDMATGSYSIQPDGLGVIDFLTAAGTIESFEISIVDQNSFVAIPQSPDVVGLGLAVRQDPASLPNGFGDADFLGNYSIELRSKLLLGAGTVPATGIGFMESNGSGGVTDGRRRLNALGSIVEETFLGRYGIGPDGMGTGNFLSSTGAMESFGIVVVNPDLNFAVSTSPGAVGIGVGRRR